MEWKKNIVKNTIVTKASLERAFLVAVATRENTIHWSVESSIAELTKLADTSGVKVVGSLVQKLSKPSKTHYLGKGKLEELHSIKASINYDVIIFNDELSPLQQKNLEETLKVKVIDRVALILDIFAQRARTREGQLQVELAQHQYLYPRLAGQWSHLERLGGGIGTRGPGESQLETDRRLIRRKIHQLKIKIEEVRKHRFLYRQQRREKEIPIIALVGYTNAGKSTLLNALSGANAFVEDKLFATLDPTTRRLVLPSNTTVLITDTVGFIRKLPPTIISAFRATLEELAEATMLLHVVDLSSQNALEQAQIVEEILSDLNLNDKPTITILNKIDKLFANENDWGEPSTLGQLLPQDGTLIGKVVPISAINKWGFSTLLEKIDKIIVDNTKNM